VLTFETEFFARHGFVKIDGTRSANRSTTDMRRSGRHRRRQFLDLPYVKPNTLGNTRMLFGTLLSDHALASCHIVVDGLWV